MLTDHKAIESWAKELLDTPSGPVGRRARWHQIFSKYDLSVGYIPGKENSIADILSRWAYPASQALRDISKHGSYDDDEEMRSIIAQENAEEAECMVIKLISPRQLLGITTRSGKTTSESPQQGQFAPPRQVHFEPEAGSHQPVSHPISHERWEGSTGEDDESDSDDEGEIVDLTEPFEPLITHDEASSSTHITMQSVSEMDWAPFYASCPVWGSIWRDTHDVSNPWPEGVKLFKDKLYFSEFLCIPTVLQQPYIRLCHDQMGHVGTERLWTHLSRTCKWADAKVARNFCEKVARQCETCQACSRDIHLKGPVEFTPIPPAIMSSVAIDLFHLPTVVWEGKTYDTVVVCVDRHSGWLVAIPALNKGLTGAKVARAMLVHQWEIFGVPSVITSDQGSHFVSAWWQTLCAHLGIRQAYSQAYHHAANGRAEVAGQQLQEVLRKLHAQEKLNWAEALPRVLRHLHDARGETGLAPYEILFGRSRHIAGLPYEPPRECEDSQVFISRMKEIDIQVSEKLNDMHKKLADRLNLKRKEGNAFANGTKVWYRRPEGSGDKLDSRWLGPAIVKGREGARSYIVELKPGMEIKAHRSFLKEYVEDVYNGQPIPLYFHQRTEVDMGAAADEWLVDKVVNHKIEGTKVKFLTTWEGHPAEEATWEDASNFLPRYNTEFVTYCKTHGLKLDLVDQLGP